MMHEEVWQDYREIFGRDPEPWREPLGALRLTLTGNPEDIDVMRAQAECEELVRIINEHVPFDKLDAIVQLSKIGYTVEPGGKR